MENEAQLKQLGRGTALALLLGAALVALCYFFVDRPIAYLVHDHCLSEYAVLKWLTYPPAILQTCVPIVLAALIVKRIWGRFRRWEKALLAACVGLALAEQFRATLAYGFGRSWPETWIDNNPSLIRDGAFGFHPFHGGAGYDSFPSGHTARMAAIAAVVWIAYPAWRGLAVLATAVVGLALVGMDYHFVGDVVAGGFVGAIVGTYTAYFMGLFREESP